MPMIAVLFPHLVPGVTLICIIFPFMLDLLVAMNRKLPVFFHILWASRKSVLSRLALAGLFLLIALLAGTARPVLAVQQKTPEPPATILAPLPGEALQGLVLISGTTQVAGFQSCEVAFSYQSDSTNTWFLLQQSRTAVSEGELAQWDTTTISDGIYRLRVQIFLSDGQVLETVIEGLRVRNYTSVETSTPAPAAPVVEAAQPTATFTPLPDFDPPQPTPQVLPTNPARLLPSDLRASLLAGSGVVVGLLLMAGIYAGLKSIFRR